MISHLKPRLAGLLSSDMQHAHQRSPKKTLTNCLCALQSGRQQKVDLGVALRNGHLCKDSYPSNTQT